MISLPEVQRYVLERVQRLEPQQLPLHLVLGLVLAEDVVAGEPVPPFANSAMDGYAARWAEVGAAPRSPVRLPVADDIPAGRTDVVPLAPRTVRQARRSVASSLRICAITSISLNSIQSSTILPCW